MSFSCTLTFVKSILRDKVETNQFAIKLKYLISYEPHIFFRFFCILNYDPLFMDWVDLPWGYKSNISK